MIILAISESSFNDVSSFSYSFVWFRFHFFLELLTLSIPFQHNEGLAVVFLFDNSMIAVAVKTFIG